MSDKRRIASLISSATEILYLLGLGPRVVGVSHECDYPRAIAGLPRLTRALVESAAASREIDEQVRTLATSGQALYEVDVVRLVELRPDLIVTQAQCDVCAVRYEDVALAVSNTPELAGTEILALNPRSIQDVLDDVVRVAQAVDDDAAIERARGFRSACASDLRARRERIAEMPSNELPRVVCLEWIDPPMVAANWMPELVELAGGQCSLTRPGVHSSYADWRAIVDYDPQVIVIVPCGFGLKRAIAEAQVLGGFEGWNDLSAVRSGHVYAVDGNAYFNRSGPRLIDSLAILSHLCRPELFPPPHDEHAVGAWRRLETRDDRLTPVP
jgi:iron complex transport system substrate-binding protein